MKHRCRRSCNSCLALQTYTADQWWCTYSCDFISHSLFVSFKCGTWVHTKVQIKWNSYRQRLFILLIDENCFGQRNGWKAESQLAGPRKKESQASFHLFFRNCFLSFFSSDFCFVFSSTGVLRFFRVHRNWTAQKSYFYCSCKANILRSVCVNCRYF